jgi:hypothetical protein
MPVRSPNFFGENSFKIITSVPGAQFRRQPFMPRDHVKPPECDPGSQVK